MRSQAEQAEIDEWGDLLFASLTHQRVDMAEQAVAGAEAWVNRTYQLQPDGEALQQDRAFVAYLKARLALAQGNLPESLAWFEHAMVLDKFYRNNPHYLYTHARGCWRLCRGADADSSRCKASGAGWLLARASCSGARGSGPRQSANGARCCRLRQMPQEMPSRIWTCWS